MAVGDITELPLTVSDLQETHPTYEDNKLEWKFLQAAYDGAKALVEYGIITQHERESTDNYNRRVAEAYGLSYSRSIVELFNFYLFKEPVKRQLGDKLANDELWELFMKDCNFDADDFDEFLLQCGRQSSIPGHCGIFVDRPARKVGTREEELDKKIYPYVALYKPLAILDWEYKRDEFNRPQLVYLKLKDDDDLYRKWWRDRWEIWREPEMHEREPRTQKYEEQRAVLVNQGDNPLGEIPLIWLYNAKTDKRGVGYSDISDIARIDASIMRNLSEIEEVIKYGAFPMLVKPWKPAGAADYDEVGIKALLGFDPEHPESKPTWLEAAVAEPIDAILKVIAKKIEEIYRSSNAGGMASMEVQTQAKSGAALKAEFQLLNAKLVRKGQQLEKAEMEIIRLWLKWQKQEKMYENIKIERAETYEVENLAMELENILTSTIIVKSDLFQKAVQKKVVRLMLPGETDEEIGEIDKEIDEYEPPEFGFEPPPPEEVPGEIGGEVVPFPEKK